MNQQENQQVQELQSKLQASQSRSFELISQVSADRDQANTNVQNLNGIIGKIVEVLGLKEPQVGEIFEAIQKLQAAAAKKSAPKLTKKGK